ncbi:MAG: IgGFc-binding protein [Nannocystaceae bacterium]
MTRSTARIALVAASLAACEGTSSPGTPVTDTAASSTNDSDSTAGPGGSSSGEPTTVGDTEVEPTSDATDTAGSDVSTTLAPTDTGDGCAPDGISCDEDVAVTCEGGVIVDEEACEGVCVAGVGCLDCEPGSVSCDGDDVVTCGQDGSVASVESCDEVQGLECQAGQCIGSCAEGWLSGDHRGCDFYPTVTANIVSSEFHFAVSIVNPGTEPANIQIDGEDDLQITTVVGGGEARVVELPWVHELKEVGSGSRVVGGGAYRLRSDEPVIVYQHNPIEWSLDPEVAYSADASLLMPVNAWGDSYRVVARNSWYEKLTQAKLPGFYAVTAAEDGTTVTLHPSPTGSAVMPGPGVAASGEGEVMLDRGDVLVVFSALAQSNPSPNDLTGTGISADAPVQVIGGHVCTFVPHDVAACDHLEESIPPEYGLDTLHVVAAPAGADEEVATLHRMVRIVATAPGTTLAFTPPINEAPAVLEQPGEYVELGPISMDFVLASSAPVLVAQYMVGGGYDGAVGDPALVVVPGVNRNVETYEVHAPPDFPESYATIVAEKEASVTVDGLTVTDFSQIVGTNYRVARVLLGPNVDGHHQIASTTRVGVSVYGLATDSSYWYTAGYNPSQL